MNYTNDVFYGKHTEAFVASFCSHLCCCMSKFSMSVSQCDKWRLAVVADMLTAERMTALSLRERVHWPRLNMSVPADYCCDGSWFAANMRYCVVKNAESYNCTHVFNVCVSLEDVGVCEKVTFYCSFSVIAALSVLCCC